MSQAAGVGPLLKTATSTLELISEQCPLLAGKEDALVSEASGLPSLGCREGVQWAARAGLPRNLESAHSDPPLLGAAGEAGCGQLARASVAAEASNHKPPWTCKFSSERCLGFCKPKASGRLHFNFNHLCHMQGLLVVQRVTGTQLRRA